MTWRCKSVRGEPFDFSRRGGGRLDDLEKIYPAVPRQKKKKHFMHGSSEEKKSCLHGAVKKKILTNHRQPDPTCSL